MQRDVERTRARMSAELDALGYKLDVPARARERVQAAGRRVRDAAPQGSDIRGTAHDNPLGVVLGGVAVGVLAGLLMPRTRVEDENIGPVADRLRDEVLATGREAAERGKTVAKRAGAAAAETVQDAGQTQGEELRKSATRRAKKVTGGR
jgi:hypothetical protein